MYFTANIANYPGLSMKFIHLKKILEKCNFFLRPILKILMPLYSECNETKLAQKLHQHFRNYRRCKLLKIHILCYFLKNINFIRNKRSLLAKCHR